jgi:hypothetical protein
MLPAMALTARASGKPGRLYGTYTTCPSKISRTSRSAVPSGTLVRLMVAMSWVWAMTRCGSSECSGVSTLGAGPSASMQPAMKRIISASVIWSMTPSGASRGSDSRVKPPRVMLRRSVPLPFTSSASTSAPSGPGTFILMEVLPPPGWTSRVSRPSRLERCTSPSSGSVPAGRLAQGSAADVWSEGVMGWNLARRRPGRERDVWPPAPAAGSFLLPSARTTHLPRAPPAGRPRRHLPARPGTGRRGHEPGVPRHRGAPRTPGRHQGAAARDERRGERRALRARDQARGAAAAPAYRPAAHRRRRRRPALLHHALHRGGVAPGQAGPRGRAARRRSGQDHARGGGRPLVRAPERRGPSRHQAGQRPPLRRPRGGHRLRRGQGGHRLQREVLAHLPRRGARHPGLHGAGAGRRRSPRGPPRRHLCHGHPGLRDAHRPAPLHGAHRAGAARGPHHASAGARECPPAGGAGGAQRPPHALPGEASRRPVAERRRAAGPAGGRGDPIHRRADPHRHHAGHLQRHGAGHPPEPPGAGGGAVRGGGGAGDRPGVCPGARPGPPRLGALRRRRTDGGWPPDHRADRPLRAPPGGGPGHRPHPSAVGGRDAALVHVAEGHPGRADRLRGAGPGGGWVHRHAAGRHRARRHAGRVGAAQGEGPDDRRRLREPHQRPRPGGLDHGGVPHRPGPVAGGAAAGHGGTRRRPGPHAARPSRPRSPRRWPARSRPARAPRRW